MYYYEFIKFIITIRIVRLLDLSKWSNKKKKSNSNDKKRYK